MIAFKLMPKNILIAPNAFKHSLSATEASQIIKNTFDSLGLNCELAPIADGGDGTIDVLNFYFPDSQFINTKVHDPLMRQINSCWLLLKNKTAVIELARSSGIALFKQDELDPFKANTFGTGELILSALNYGCRKIILTVGGSATIDAGLGIMSALGVTLYDQLSNQLSPCYENLKLIEKIDFSSLSLEISNCEFSVLCDVQNCLVSKEGVVKFALQKGFSKSALDEIERNINQYAKSAIKISGKDFQLEPMTGAAGGVPFSLKTFFNAKLFPAFLFLADIINLEKKIEKSDLVITGEGSLDSQSLMGKGVIELAKLSKKYGKKVIVFCGSFDETINWKEHFIDHVIKINPNGLPLEESIKSVKKLLETAVIKSNQLFRDYKNLQNH